MVQRRPGQRHTGTASWGVQELGVEQARLGIGRVGERAHASGAWSARHSLLDVGRDQIQIRSHGIAVTMAARSAAALLEQLGNVTMQIVRGLIVFGASDGVAVVHISFSATQEKTIYQENRSVVHGLDKR
jgi:hypothetical protein